MSFGIRQRRAITEAKVTVMLVANSQESWLGHQSFPYATLYSVRILLFQQIFSKMRLCLLSRFLRNSISVLQPLQTIVFVVVCEGNICMYVVEVIKEKFSLSQEILFIVFHVTTFYIFYQRYSKLRDMIPIIIFILITYPNQRLIIHPCMCSFSCII